MSYLLDTNVLSETVRPAPHKAVTAWLDSVPDHSLYLSVLTLGELRKGVELLPRGAKRERLAVWLEQVLPAWFEDRLLPIDSRVAHEWGRLQARSRRPLPAIDSLLAATARTHGLRVVTRNVGDFAFAEVEVINPWEAGPETQR